MFAARLFVLNPVTATKADTTVRASIISSTKTTTKIKG